MKSNRKEQEAEYALLESLRARNVNAFLELYQMYGDDLLIYCFGKLEDRTIATKAVEDLFEKLWRNRSLMKAVPPLYPFLKAELDKICKNVTDSSPRASPARKDLFS
jgi:hypothetical protein